jgi:N-formylglutamate deformylase
MRQGAAMDIFTLHRGAAPLLISVPHDGTEIPDALRARMTPQALRVPDTDWHVSKLYHFARELDASLIVPRCSRYVVDLNRPPDGAALYPGKTETGLCPTVTFGGEPVYLPGQEPGADEIQSRVETYWKPYHRKLQETLERLLGRQGRVVLWEGHTIRSEVPMLFEGRLPDFNLGTGDGKSCAAALLEKLTLVLQDQNAYTHVVNGRFKGGYITRHYGNPARAINAVQLELSQRIYMDEATGAYDAGKAAPVQALIRRLLACCL